MNKGKIQKIVAIIAAICTATAFLPKAYSVYKTKKVSGLNLKTLILFFIGQILWFIDGNITGDIGLLASSSLNSIVYIYLIYAKYNY